MNVLNVSSMGEIAELTDMIKSDESIKGAVITSGKKAFCAGADLEEMGGNLAGASAAMAKDPEAAKKALFDNVYKLNQLFRDLETCGKPVAAALNGLALGGGFELVLACTGRFVANDNKSAKVGLPEALIGLLPGAGGTQRLPRLVGLMNASAVLLQGKQLRAAEAQAMGIFHAAVPADELIATAKKWVLDNPKAKQPWDEDRFRLRSLFLSKQALEKGEARPAGQKKGDVKKVGVIGAGFMGAGVAYVSAYAGIDVVLIDRDQEGADKGKQHAADLLTKRVKRKKMTQEKADEITDRITATTDYKQSQNYENG